ncbi:MAG TPA: lipid kinase [Myxococcaceae bacterium]|nr:lipid kinase [Myxococcaceae bacterium]
MPEPLRAALLVNARARAGKRAFALARATLEAAGVTLVECALGARSEPLLEVLDRALAAGVRLVVLGGGDGTLHALVPRLVSAGATLGIVPLGTGNDFARSLGIPLDIVHACHVVSGGRTATVDLGVLNGRPFLNAVSVGITAELTRRLTPASKRVLGPAAYPVASIRAAARFRPFEAEVEVDGTRKSVRALQLVVGNARYQGGGRLIDPEASATDRTLHGYVVVARHRDRLRNLLELASVGRRTRAGTHVEHPGVWSFGGERVRVVTAPVRSLVADGELVGETPVDLAVLPARLRVRVPVDARLES